MIAKAISPKADSCRMGGLHSIRLVGNAYL